MHFATILGDGASYKNWETNHERQNQWRNIFGLLCYHNQNQLAQKPFHGIFPQIPAFLSIVSPQKWSQHSFLKCFFVIYPSGYFCDLPQRLFLHCVIILHSSHSLTCIPPDHIREIQKEKTKVLFWVQLPHHLTYKLSLSKFGLSRFRNVCELTTRHLVAETLISYFANDENCLHSSPILFCKFDIIRKSWTLKLKTGKTFSNFSSL